MDILSNIVRKTDFLGRKHSPTFKSQTSVHTCFGGVLSIVFCATVSVGIFFLGRELYERKIPLSNLSESRQDTNEINLTAIQPIFTILDRTGKTLINDKHFFESFKISFFLFSPELLEDGSLSLKRIEIPFTVCSESLLEKDHYNLLVANEIPVEGYICIDKSKAVDSKGEKITEPLLVRNMRSSIGGFSFRFEITEIGSKKSKAAFNVYMITKTSYLDIKSYDSPIKDVLEEVYQKVIPGEDKELSLRYKINELKTDTGYIFSTNETRQYFSLNSTSRETHGYSKTQRRIISVIFDVSMMRNVTSRKYLKLQQLIANIGGFIKAMTIILGFTLKTYSEMTLFNSINQERWKIEGKTYILPKNKSTHNNFIEEKTFSTVLNKATPVIRHSGFCRYLKALLPFSQDNALKSHIENTFAYFDVLTNIKLDYRVRLLEQNLKELINK